MTIITCERCGEQTPKIEVCNYCNKKICYLCIKSQKRIKKVMRYFICKSCWSTISLRKQFKSA